MAETKGSWSPFLYGSFFGVVVVVTAGLVVAGYVLAPGQPEGWFRAAAAACLVSGLASALAGTLLTVRGGTPQQALNRFLIAMLVRLALVALLAAAVILGFGVDLGPFLTWLVASYLALLAVDTIFAIRVSRSL